MKRHQIYEETFFNRVPDEDDLLYDAQRREESSDTVYVVIDSLCYRVNLQLMDSFAFFFQNMAYYPMITTIFIAETTVACVEFTIAKLVEEGFFDSLIPLGQDRVNLETLTLHPGPHSYALVKYGTYRLDLHD